MMVALLTDNLPETARVLEANRSVVDDVFYGVKSPLRRRMAMSASPEVLKPSLNVA